MFGRLARGCFGFAKTTQMQQHFLASLKLMDFRSDADLYKNINEIYHNREYILETADMENCLYKAESYMLRKAPCSATILGCYYKLQEMRLLSPGFKHDLLRKYHQHLVSIDSVPPNTLEKYLWFLYQQSRFERHLFTDAAESHTLGLLDLHQYMNSLPKMKKWEPYVRVVNMLRYLGHQVKMHPGLQVKRTIEGLDYTHLPFLTDLYSEEEMKRIRVEQNYDEPFLTFISMEFFNRNNSQYDAYLQRVEEVEHEVHHERQVDVIAWPDFVPALQMVRRHFEVMDTDHDLEHLLVQLFSRLAEKAEIDLETATSILQIMEEDPDFLSTRRFPVVRRTIECIPNQPLEEFRFFPAAGYVQLLEWSKKLQNKVERQEIQNLICRKIQVKAVWEQGDKDLIKECLKKETIVGGDKLLKKLDSPDL